MLFLLLSKTNFISQLLIILPLYLRGVYSFIAECLTCDLNSNWFLNEKEPISTERMTLLIRKMICFSDSLTVYIPFDSKIFEYEYFHFLSKHVSLSLKHPKLVFVPYRFQYINGDVL
jgi:hypothetical protein